MYLIIPIARSHGWLVQKLDVHNSFLHGTLFYLVYMKHSPITPIWNMYVSCRNCSTIWNRRPEHGLNSSLIFSCASASHRLRPMFHYSFIYLTPPMCTSLSMIGKFTFVFIIRDLGSLHFFSLASKPFRARGDSPLLQAIYSGWNGQLSCSCHTYFHLQKFYNWMSCLMIPLNIGVS